MNPDIERCTAELLAKQRAIRKAWDYYDGRHPLVYSSARLKQVFRRLDARFTLNWCSVVVDAALDRLKLQTIDVVSDPEADRLLRDLLVETQMSLEAHEVHRACLVAGEAFAIAWREDPGSKIEAYAHDPLRCHAIYDEEKPNEMRVAAKCWPSQGAWAMSLYYADRIEHYRSDRSRFGDGVWELEQEVENPYGQIPVFHWRRERRATLGELDSLYELQDAVNKLLNDMMISAEFGVFAQRYVVSNADVGTLRNAPDQIWQIPASESQEESTQVGQFEPMRLSNFLEPLSDLAAAIAIISRTPRHYFLRQGGDPSGEALATMEAPLVSKVSRYQDQFTPTWRELGRFLLRLDDVEVAPAAIAPRFAPPSALPPKLLADVRESSVRAGIPLEVQLRRNEGWTDEEVAALKGGKK